jgi:hypothetical protein
MYQGKMRKAIKLLKSGHDEYDRDFCNAIKKNKLTPALLQKRLTKYSVVRSFSNEKKEGAKRFEKIVSFLNDFKITDPVKSVNQLNKFIIENYKVNALSASSKILWAYDPRNIVIYDQKAVKSLKKMGAIGVRDNYEYYYESWMHYYDLHKELIVSSCKEIDLSELPYQKQALYYRAFDKYLWQMN